MNEKDLDKYTSKDNTIIINIKGIKKKVFKITPHSDGGFNVHLPYHKEKTGYLYTIKVPYYEGNFSINYENAITKEFIVDTDVKLSFHRSGFVQFSKGAEVLSGIDQKTGETKGLGIKIGPLDYPIESGPTFGVVVWGLHLFDNLEKKEGNKNYIEFNEKDAIPIRNTPNAYHIGAWVFPQEHKKWIEEVNGELVVVRKFANYLPDPERIFILKVILIKNCPSFIALFMEEFMMGNEFGESGYSLNGPSQLFPERVNGHIVGNHIKAAYPKPPGFRNYNDIQSIHRDN